MSGKQKGIFITFEGGEGSGKTTQARILHEHLTSLGWEAILSREPGGTPFGEKLRKVLLHPQSAGMDPLSELMLYMACRREHVARIIRPELEKGTTVIVDRFSDATAAYQGYGRGVDLALIEDLDRLVCEGLSPDITFLLEMGSVEEGLRRALARHATLKTEDVESRFEMEDLLFHENVRRGYLELAGRFADRIVVVDGRRSIEEIGNDLLKAMRDRFPSMEWGG